jgi:hypothetical protein
MEVSKPPGVFSSRIKTPAPSFSAFAKFLFMYSTMMGLTASSHLA